MRKEVINDELFRFYRSGLNDYAKAANSRDGARLHFYMGVFQTCVTIYAKINNVSLEEAEETFKERLKKQQ